MHPFPCRDSPAGCAGRYNQQSTDIHQYQQITFTVTAGAANVLVVILLEKAATSTGITPTTLDLEWSDALTRAVKNH